MTIKQLNAIEEEILCGLRNRFDAGDNSAGQVILEHLREVGKNISIWQKSKKQEEKQAANETH